MFEDNKHIIFIDENKVHLWKDKIEDMLGDVEKYKLISSQGKNLVKRNNNLETFSQKLMKIIDF